MGQVGREAGFGFTHTNTLHNAVPCYTGPRGRGYRLILLYMEILLLVGRILFGGFFALGGAIHFMKLHDMSAYAQSKGAPAPKLSVIVTGLVVMLAGLGVVFGIYLSISLLAIMAFLIVITPVMHDFWKISDSNMRMLEMQMFMKNLALLGAALVIYILTFPGA